MSSTKEKILALMCEEKQPMSIGEIAQKIGVSWATVKTNVLELSQEKMLNIKKVGKNWIIWRDDTNKPFKSCSVYKRS
ncbi:MAG: HTH domain-containing protein [Halobacteriota archaeon]|nr:HTH domain-containing protein [Halobacteriota archaeon]